MFDAELTVPAGLPAVGELVGGKYLLERYFAEGGMGILALGRHVELDEPVALKFLKPEIVAADPTGTVASRFVREARATIKIRSEHVPRIFDVSTLDAGLPFIVMELLDGADLDQLLERDGPLAVGLLVDLVLQALEALAAAHALGMVHRDLKPANLFVAKRLDGSTCVKVLDFGIAKLVDRNGAVDSALTGTNAAMGSPRYMSPEQMRSARDVDARADIWAVGTTLYELLLGTPPFDGETLTQVCAAILQDEPGSISSRRPDVPVALEMVVLRCLEKSASDRYRNVAELAAALAPFGTAPLAGELALRVARVLGTAAPPTPALTAAGTEPATRPSALQRSAGAAMVTSTSWHRERAPATAAPRRARSLAMVLGVLFVIGAAAGLFSMRRDRDRDRAAAKPAATSTDPRIHEGSNAAPSDLGATLAATPAVSLTATSSSASAESAAGVPPGTGSSVAKPSHAKPGSEPKAGASTPKVSPAATSTTRATSPAGGLWDDRK